MQFTEKDYEKKQEIYITLTHMLRDLCDYI